jgi:hypothetical protein
MLKVKWNILRMFVDNIGLNIDYNYPPEDGANRQQRQPAMFFPKELVILIRKLFYSGYD